MHRVIIHQLLYMFTCSVKLQPLRQRHERVKSIVYFAFHLAFCTRLSFQLHRTYDRTNTSYITNAKTECNLARKDLGYYLPACMHWQRTTATLPPGAAHPSDSDQLKPDLFRPARRHRLSAANDRQGRRTDCF